MIWVTAMRVRSTLVFFVALRFASSSAVGDAKPRSLDPRTPSPIIWQGQKITAISFADSETLVTGSATRGLRLWKIPTGELLAELTGHPKEIVGLCVDSSRRILVSASRDGTIRGWDLGSRAILWTSTRGKATTASGVLATACVPGSRAIVSLHIDGYLRSWSLSTGAALGSPTWTLKPEIGDGHLFGATTLTSSSDGETLLVSDEDGHIETHDDFLVFRVSTSGSTGFHLERVKLSYEDPRSGIELIGESRWFAPTAPPLLTPDGKWVVQTLDAHDGYYLRMGRLLRRKGARPWIYRMQSLVKMDDELRLLAVSGHGRYTVCADNPLLLELPRHPSIAVITGVGMTVHRFPLPRFVQMNTPIAYTSAGAHEETTLDAVAFSPDGRSLATSCKGRVLLWDL
jgi:WD40 repeat protein